ncbi:hypothetical protein [Halomicronema sp. CCY15110]|nr:hypothetical protein [Halomicronema sp. CCY15110]
MQANFQRHFSPIIATFVEETHQWHMQRRFEGEGIPLAEAGAVSR